MRLRRLHSIFRSSDDVTILGSCAMRHAHSSSSLGPSAISRGAFYTRCRSLVPFPSTSFSTSPLFRLDALLRPRRHISSDPSIATSLSPPATGDGVRASASASGTSPPDPDFREACRASELYWKQPLDRSAPPMVTNPVAQRLRARLRFDTSPLGLSPEERRGVPLVADMDEWKGAHPDKVVLARCGEFYETSGVDAVMLVNYAGLNAMGSKIRAGCPAGNVRATLRKLVEHGFSVVVVEERRDYTYSTAKGRASRKERFIGDIVTKARPLYRGQDVTLIDDECEGSDEAPLSPVLLGIATDSSGLMVLEANLDLRVVEVTEGLTPEAVESHIYRGGLSPPVYLHASLERSGDPQRAADWARRVRAALRAYATDQARAYAHADPLEGFLGVVARDQGLDRGDPDSEGGVTTGPGFRIVRRSRGGRPRPLYLSTATQIGVEPTRGVPSLVDALLPRESPKAYGKLLKQLLLVPPPYEVADGIRAAVRLLRCTTEALPEMPVVLPGRASALLDPRPPASMPLLRDLQRLCLDVRALCTAAPGGGPSARACMVSSLLPAVVQAMGAEGLTPEGMAEGCSAALDELDACLAPEGSPQRGAYDAALGAARDAARQYYVTCALEGGTLGPRDEAAPLEALCALLSHKEGEMRGEWLGLGGGDGEAGAGDYRLGAALCRSPAFTAQLAEVQAKGIRVVEAVEALFVALRTAVVKDEAVLGRLVFNEMNENVFVVFEGSARGKKAKEVVTRASLVPARDRYNEEMAGRYTTPELATALLHWHRACFELETANNRSLLECARALRPYAQLLQSAAFLSLLLGALKAHVREGGRRGWTEAELEPLPGGGLPLPPRAPTCTLAVSGLFPYWMEASDPATVTNSFDMSRLFLLTGANMSGKSTALRATCAAALLATVGLLVPCAGGMRAPRFDAVTLRNFSQDDVAEGRSSFKVEMAQMAAVLTEATDRSLVLLDELGRGTTPESGAAIAGAMLEALAGARPLGVFATHLHRIFELPLDMAHTEEWMMEIVEGEGGLRAPSHRIVRGRTADAMALQVAESCGVPPHIIDRARQLEALLEAAALRGALDTPGPDSEDYDESNGTPPRPRSRAPPSAPPPPPSPSASLPSIQDAGAVLRECLGHVMPEWDGARVEVIDRPRLEPPPAASNRACVYVVRRPGDGAFYVGETDRLLERFREHKTRKPVKGGPELELAYVALPSSSEGRGAEEKGVRGGGGGGKSRARHLETMLLRRLATLGYELISVRDAQNRSFGD